MTSQVFQWAVDVHAEFVSAGAAIPPGVQRLLPNLDVVMWAAGRRAPPTAAELQEQFNVSRATAYRWLQVLGKPQPGGEIKHCESLMNTLNGTGSAR